eukprot:3088266-Pyramimonas_sp.AAC.1
MPAGLSGAPALADIGAFLSKTPAAARRAMRMQGPWRAILELFERGAANESGQAWTEEARMQGYPWENCPSLLYGFT